MAKIDIYIDGSVYAEVPHGGIARMWTNIINLLPQHGCNVVLAVPALASLPKHLSPRVDLRMHPKSTDLRPGRFFRGICSEINRKRLQKFWSIPRKGVFQSTHFTTYSSLNIPQALTVHDLFHERMKDCFPDLKSKIFCERRAECVNAADFIICDSDATARDVCITYPALTTPRRTVWLAVDPVFCQNTESVGFVVPGLKKPFVLYVGTRYAYKNFFGLLAGYASWKRRDEYQLLVIGRQPSDLENAMIRSWGLPDDIVFCDANDEMLLWAYKKANAVVVPSLSEGFGLPVWEAMACGTPVVSSKGGSLTEIGRGYPFHFDFGSPCNLASALNDAVSEPPKSQRLENAQAFVLRRSWSEVVAEYVDVYRKLSSAY